MDALLIGAVTNTSISLFFNASAAFFIESKEYCRDSVDGFPRVISIFFSQIFNKLAFL